MMGVGAKRALGLYRSCAPRQLMACFVLFLIVSSQEPDSSTHPHLSLPTAIAGKVFPSRKRPTMKCKTFRNNE